MSDMPERRDFDELAFFAGVKKRPAMYIGRRSLIGLRDMVFGMKLAFSFCGERDALRYYTEFIERCNRRLMETDSNGYSCWWNHMLYISGNDDELALMHFFREFERFLDEEYGEKLPEVK